MASQVEVQAPGEFIYSTASGTRSLENVIVVAGAGLLPSGRIMGKITAGGKYDNYRADNLPVGVSTAVGILYAEVDATGAADVPAVIVVRDAEVVTARVSAEVGADKAAAVTAFATAGLIFR
jgi:hypothetical protein